LVWDYGWVFGIEGIGCEEGDYGCTVLGLEVLFRGWGWV
jgi:hypothetical protein